MFPRKALLLVVLIAAALAPAGIAYPSPSSASDVTHVYGGGRFGPGCFDGPDPFCFPKPRDFSLDAHRAGRVVTGTLTYGLSIFWRGQITCTTVAGNRAAIGGIIRSASDPSSVGSSFVIFFIDNGLLASSTLDRASALDLLGPEDTFPGEPRGFPYVCPSSADSWFGYQDLNGGDVVVVQDGER